MTDVSERFTSLPDDQTLGATLVAPEKHAFGDVESRSLITAMICTGTTRSS